jgi:hypothetical protein
MSFWDDVIDRVRTASISAPFGVTRVGETLVYGEHILSITYASDEEIIQFYMDKVGLTLEFVRITQWKDIKKKSVRDGLLREYVFRNTHLEDDELQHMLSNFHLNISIKKIQHDNIKIGEDGFIETIEADEDIFTILQLPSEVYE